MVSCYQSDLSWLEPVRYRLADQDHRVFLYDKWNGEGASQAGQFLGHEIDRGNAEDLCYANLPNVGKCDHSYLHHIAERHDDLADWTVFVPDNVYAKLPIGISLEDALTPGPTAKVPLVYRAREWGPDGRIRWDQFTDRPDRNGTNYAERYASGKISRAELSYVEWSKACLGYDPDGPDPWPGYMPTGVLAAPKRSLDYLPRAFYARLRDQLSGYREPEEAHYMERSWLVVLTGRAHWGNLVMDKEHAA